jgi:hypothetical protein
MTRTKTFSIFLIASIFAVSLGFSFLANIQPHVDAKAYNRIGWNLARGLGYIENRQNAHDPLRDDAIFRIGPGYEFFLAGLYRLFGGEARMDPLSYRDKLWVIWIAQAFLRALTAWFVLKIALCLFSYHNQKHRLALAAAIIFGFLPDLIIINGFILYETLLLFFGVGAVYFSLNYITYRPDRSHSTYFVLFAASLFWALAILTRPSELFAFLVLPAALVWQKNWRGALVSFFFPILLVGGWSLRNSLLYDQPLFTTTAGAYALWVGNNEKATGGYDRPALLREARERYHSTELSAVSINAVKHFVLDRPLKFFELQFKKAIMYASLIRPTGFWPELQHHQIIQWLLIAASAIGTAFLFIFAVTGALLFWHDRSSLRVAFLGFVIAKPLAVIPFYVETRYRYGIYPLLALLAAFPAVAFWHADADRKKTILKILGGVCILFLAMSAIDAWYSFDTIMTRLYETFF